MATIKSVSKLVVDGDWIESKDQSDSGVRLIQTGNIGLGEYYDKRNKAKFISEETFLRLKCTEVLPGDILISRLPDPVGRACIVPKQEEKAITAVDCTIVRLNSDIIDSRFFLNYTQSSKYFNQLHQFLAGSTRTRISRKNLEKVELPIPSLNEQRRIASILDKVSSFISLRKQQLAKLDELVKARFVEMFGENFDMAPLNQVCTFIDYRGKTPEKSDSGIPLITAKNVKENSFSIEPQEFIPEENYEIVMTRGIPKVNDVLFTTEAPLGNVCRIPDVYKLFCVGQRIITMQPNKGTVTSEYLEYALRDKRFQDKMWEKSSGSTVKGIRSKLLEWLTIPVPPYGLQYNFSEFVQRADKQKLTIQQSLDKLMILKKSLMQEYFG